MDFWELSVSISNNTNSTCFQLVLVRQTYILHLSPSRNPSSSEFFWCSSSQKQTHTQCQGKLLLDSTAIVQLNVLCYLNYRNRRSGSNGTIYLQDFSQCPKGLKIAVVLLRSKRNSLTLHLGHSFPDFFYFQEDFVKVRSANCKDHITVFPL